MLLVTRVSSACEVQLMVRVPLPNLTNLSCRYLLSPNPYQVLGLQRHLVQMIYFFQLLIGRRHILPTVYPPNKSLENFHHASLLFLKHGWPVINLQLPPGILHDR